MFNSWGQRLEEGSVVYRGARQGNSSEYKVGVVESLKPGKNPRIKWRFEATVRWIRIDGEQVLVPCIWSMNSAGSPSIDGLVVVDFDLDELERRAQFFKSINGVAFNSLQEFNVALATFQM
ncbi:hypothetical protein SEA_FAUST_102 [Streptomyces phage Faust]|uniref:Uncharacterized protein n=1 Tax=Streptomyces phage Faust TaxID=2767565 RepID=A0A7G9UYU4_9CAUD|nr:hypothetical protein PP456_gp160 [Streptomyces phage Faust]QNN99199.1 hypothetical protein SEA_FAUST_102 [Streptomyces phage Faust]